MADNLPAKQSQLEIQPQSLFSDEDFVVIDKSSGSASSPPTPLSPSQENSEQNSAVYQLSLACPKKSASESEFQKMAEQISQVKEKQTSLQASLQGNSHSLEQFRVVMSERLGEMKKNLADKDAELGAKNAQCESLLASNKELKTELARLSNREEEWAQTNKDYQKLKNEYNLLTNTKARLEEEKADLQRSRDEAVAMETQKLRAKFDEERNAAVEAERAEWEQELKDLKDSHTESIRNLQQQLTGAKKENEGNLEAARADSERALAAERSKCRQEVEVLLAQHTSAIETMRKEFEEKIREQVRLTEEARQELQELNQKHEAEKAEMFDIVKQFNVSSFSTEQFRTGNATTMTDSSNSSGNCAQVEEVRTLREREAVQEQGFSSLRSTLAPQPVDRVVGSMCISVSTSDVGVGTSVDIVNASTSTGCDNQSGDSTDGTAPSADQPDCSSVALDVKFKSAESQTDPLECPQVENSESLQKNSATRSLMVQLASFAAALKTERLKVEDLEKNLKQLQQENADLQAQISRKSGFSPDQADNEAASLRKQLADKQSELDSVVKELDETRSKVCELTEKVKYLESRKMKKQLFGDESAGGDTGALQQQNSQKDAEIGRLQQLLQKKQNELDSLLEDFDETRHKVYELSEKIKEYKCRAEQRAHLANSRAYATGGDASRLEKLLAEKQVELDSVLEDFDETRTKVYELSERIKDYESRSRSAPGDGYASSGAVSKLEKQLADKQTELDSVIKDLDETRTKVYELNEKVKDYESRGSCQTEQLQKQLNAKQTELDSVLQDFDETRHKVYELNEKVKDYESRTSQGDTQTDKLKQKIRELESQSDIDRNMANQLQMEIDSAREQQAFKATKLQAAEDKVEQLQQEIKQLKAQEDELRKQCRDSDETVQQVLADSDGMRKELSELREKCQVQREVLDQNKKTLEAKADLESKLKDTIAELTSRIESHADESEKILKEEKRKSEQLYRKFCEQSEIRIEIERQLKTAIDRLNEEHQKLLDSQRQHEETRRQLRECNSQLDQARQQLNNANHRLDESEKAVADLQNYSDSVDKALEDARQQLQESTKKRDDVIQVAETMRNRLEEELRKSADLETELQQLKLEHSKLRTEYSGLERNATDMLAKEHELSSQLGEARTRIQQAEDAIQWYKDQLRDRQVQIEELFKEQDQLRGRVNNLLEALDNQQQQVSGSDLFNKHRSMKPPGGSGH